MPRARKCKEGANGMKGDVDSAVEGATRCTYSAVSDVRGKPRGSVTTPRLDALLGGYFVWGGGVRVVFVNPGERSGSEEAPAPTWHSMVRAMGSP